LPHSLRIFHEPTGKLMLNALPAPRSQGRSARAEKEDHRGPRLRADF